MRRASFRNCVGAHQDRSRLVSTTGLPQKHRNTEISLVGTALDAQASGAVPTKKLCVSVSLWQTGGAGADADLTWRDRNRFLTRFVLTLAANSEQVSVSQTKNAYD